MKTIEKMYLSKITLPSNQNFGSFFTFIFKRKLWGALWIGL